MQVRFRMTEQPAVPMDCAISAYPSSNPNPAPSASASSSSSSSKHNNNKAMDHPVRTAVSSDRSPNKSNKDGLHVNFDTGKVEIQERKKKFLTAKYGTHQMNLIKKRLSVEMWVYDQLQFLFGVKDCDSEVELDLDELLDIETDIERRSWLVDKLENAMQSQEVVRKFIDELIKRARTL